MMGKIAKPQRSKKNKKLKSIDPFYKGDRKNRRLAQQNQKPSSYDQEVPKKLRMLGFSIDNTRLEGMGKKSKNKFKVQKNSDAPTKYTNKFNTPLGDKSSQPKPAAKKKTPVKNEEIENEDTPRKSKKERRKERAEEIKKAKMGKRSKPEIPKEVVSEYIDNLKPTRPYLQPKFKQKGTETDAEFMRRVDEEAQQAITKSKIDSKFEMSDEKQMREKMRKTHKAAINKKKERLKEKKQQKVQALKEKKKEKLMDFNALQDKRVAFGEVVHAPPSISVKPKKAKNVMDHDKPGLRMPELKDAIAKNVAESQGFNAASPQTTVKREVGKTLKRKNLSTTQKVLSDAQRESVIEAYRMMKKKKS